MSGVKKVDYDEARVERAAVSAKADDIDSRNALFMEHYALISRLGRSARRLLWSAHTDRALQSGDIDQQAFIEFCALLDEWQPGQVPFMAYLATMLPWRLLHYVRRSLHYRSRARLVPLPTVQSGEETADDDNAQTEEGMEFADDGAQHNITRIESSDTWKYHTDPLEDGLREAVRLRYGLGLSSREIASMRGCSRRTIDRELRAAISAIKRKIEDEWENCS